MTTADRIHARPSADSPLRGQVPSGIEELRSILSGPLPDLPAGVLATKAREMRTISTPRSQAAWCHPTWRAVVGWIWDRKPSCDPVVPAIHAVERAERVRRSPAEAASVGKYILRVADSYRGVRRPIREVPMGLDIADTEDREHPTPRSLSIEAGIVLRREGINMGDGARRLVSEGVDIAVDWWVDVAMASGLTGAELIQTVTGDSSGFSSGRRLRRYFEGPAGRPLVALLLGGDQLGSIAQRSVGARPSLVLAALEARQALAAGRTLTRPAPPAVRAWRTAVDRIEAVVATEPDRGLGPEPVVAA